MKTCKFKLEIIIPPIILYHLAFISLYIIFVFFWICNLQLEDVFLVIWTNVLFIILHNIMHSRTSWIELKIFFWIGRLRCFQKKLNYILTYIVEKKGRKDNVYKIAKNSEEKFQNILQGFISPANRVYVYILKSN